MRDNWILQGLAHVASQIIVFVGGYIVLGAWILFLILFLPMSVMLIVLGFFLYPLPVGIGIAVVVMWSGCFRDIKEIRSWK